MTGNHAAGPLAAELLAVALDHIDHPTRPGPKGGAR
jgi:hypothetical protein